jgi:hypothetical protein
MFQDLYSDLGNSGCRFSDRMEAYGRPPDLHDAVVNQLINQVLMIELFF